jgi:hypothetical protein
MRDGTASPDISMESHAMDDRARAQIEILRTLQALFAANRIRWWLRGGWAVDFMLGRITRPHGDIDIVVWAPHRRRLYRLLAEAGFDLAREWPPTQTDFQIHNEILSLAYLTRTSNGRVITAGIPVWEWPDGSLGRRPRHLEGVAARVVGPRQLHWEKASTERGTGRPLRPKDVTSMETLREIIASGLIPG